MIKMDLMSAKKIGRAIIDVGMMVMGMMTMCMDMTHIYEMAMAMMVRGVQEIR